MLKAIFEPVRTQHHNSFSINVLQKEALSALNHYHPEFELAFISKGTGKRYIGDYVGCFSKGDLVFLGPNLSHCWKFDDYADDEMEEVIVINFTRDFLGDDFFCKPELFEISRLLERGVNGIIYHPSVIQNVTDELSQLVNEESSFKRLHLFLDILHQIAVARNYTLVDQLCYVPISGTSDQERISKVFSYIRDNYKTNVCLDEAAQLACMSPNSFCKFFKKATHKTFVEVVVEYRLQYAITQLLHTSKSVTQICFDCGFNDIIYFNRMFKLKMHLSPLQYKKKYQKTLSVM
jgi:AraC-like DNA-binding protein